MKRLLISIVLLLVMVVAQAQQQVVHTVQNGETLESIAQRYHVTVDEILKSNPYAGETFHVGLKLYISASNTDRSAEKRVYSPVNAGDVSSYSQNQQYTDQNQTNPQRASGFYQEQEGGMELQYHAIDEGWGLGLSWVASHFVFGYEYFFGKQNEGVTKNMGMEIYLGGNYRYHIIDNVFLEGRVLVGYFNWNLKVKGYEEQKTNDVFIGLSPRAGLKFGKVAITAGYRWDWNKFKFKKANCLDRFTVGLTIIF